MNERGLYLPLTYNPEEDSMGVYLPSDGQTQPSAVPPGKVLVLVETISQHRMRYAVLADKEEHACDDVVMERAAELSQEFIGESILSSRVISEAEYFRIFDKDNAYLSSWDREKKLNMIHKINYEE
jgi:hypothetical protein